MMWPFRKRARGGEVGPSWVSPYVDRGGELPTPRPDAFDLVNLSSGTMAVAGYNWAKCLKCSKYFIGERPARVHFAALRHQCLDE